MVVIHTSLYPPLASGSSALRAGDARTEQRRASEVHTTGGVPTQRRLLGALSTHQSFTLPLKYKTKKKKNPRCRNLTFALLKKKVSGFQCFKPPLQHVGNDALNCSSCSNFCFINQPLNNENIPPKNCRQKRASLGSAARWQRSPHAGTLISIWILSSASSRPNVSVVQCRCRSWLSTNQRASPHHEQDLHSSLTENCYQGRYELMQHTTGAD